MPGCRIGDRCTLGQNVVVSPGVVLGENCKVQNNVSIYTGVICEDDVFLGPSMVFTNVINPRSAINRRDEFMETRVGRGPRSVPTQRSSADTISGPLRLSARCGRYKNRSPYALVVGNPARMIGWVSEYGHRLEFDENSEAECPESGEHYILKNGKVSKVF